MTNLELGGFRLTIDPDYPDKIEIEVMENGVGVEGGQFDYQAFIDHVRKFYDANF
jgi:hypothetical protein